MNVCATQRRDATDNGLNTEYYGILQIATPQGGLISESQALTDVGAADVVFPTPATDPKC